VPKSATKPSTKVVEKSEKEKIVPKLQVKPVAIIDRFDGTQVVVHILNYSEYVAKNINLDVKFGDHTWKRETDMAVSCQ
jgi:hypothetical protein